MSAPCSWQTRSRVWRGAPIGVHAICADAIDDAAAAFYREHQFQPFVSRTHTLYLPMKTALALVAKGTGKEKS